MRIAHILLCTGLLAFGGMTSLSAGEGGKGKQAERSIEDRLEHVNQHPRKVERLDANGDGVVDAAELQAARQARLNKFDSDGDGKLSEDERAAMRAERVARIRQHLEEKKAEGKTKKFDRVDSNGDGSLSDEEIIAHLKNRKDKAGKNEKKPGKKANQ